jgi:hypothetical protein
MTGSAPVPSARSLASAQRGAGLLLHLVALLPALLLLRAIDLYAVDVPFMDDWQFVPLVERVRGGEIPWKELAAPHDEHRLLIPRVLIIASTILSHGNYRVQCFVTFGVALALSLALLFLLRRSLGTGLLTPVAWLLANLVLLSPIQWHNWLWPMQFCYFLPFTLLGLCLAAFYSDLSAGARFALCQVCAWAASFSFVHGLLLWPVMLPALLRDGRWGSPRARRLAAAAWLGAGLLAGYLYFDGLFANTADPAYAYQHKGEPPTASTLRLLDEQPLATLARMARFALAMLGNATLRGLPVSSNLALSIRCGLLLLVAALVLCAVLARRGGLAGPRFAWAVLLLHGFVAAAFVGVGRVSIGPGQPMTPRYITYGSFCLLPVVMLACLWFARAARASREAAFLACGLLLAAIGVDWAYGLNLMREWHDVRMASRAAIHFSQQTAPPSLHLVGGRKKFIMRQVAALDRLGFWNPPLARSLRLDQFRVLGKLPAKEGRVRGLEARGDGSWRIRGNARFGVKGTPDAILVTSADASGAQEIRAVCETRSPARWQRHAYSRDWEFVKRYRETRYGSFSCAIDPPAIPSGESRVVQLWALDFAQLGVHRFAKEVTLPETTASR